MRDRLEIVSRAVSFLLVLGLSGCAVLKDPNAVVTVDGANSKVAITQADKRAVFLFDQKSNAYACPEPSPDVKADVEGALKALLDTSAKVPDKLEGAAKLEFDATRKIVTAALLQRSQGLQVLRDMLFQACLANLRGDMSSIQYHSFISRTLPQLTMTLIAAEMVTKQDSGKPALTGEDLKLFLNFLVLNKPD